jgi:tetratricopeptide (TPR) repeat protein
LYQAPARYAEAEPLFKRSLALKESSLGPTHPSLAPTLGNPDVAMSLNNLASLYEAQGRYPDAEPLYKQSLAILEKLLGKDHPNIATSLSNLAELY